MSPQDDDRWPPAPWQARLDRLYVRFIWVSVVAIALLAALRELA